MLKLDVGDLQLVLGQIATFRFESDTKATLRFNISDTSVLRAQYYGNTIALNAVKSGNVTFSVSQAGFTSQKINVSIRLAAQLPRFFDRTYFSKQYFSVKWFR